MEVRHPELTFATPDHDVSTLGNATHSDLTAIPRVADNAREHGIMLFGLATGARHSLTEALRQMGAYTALISKGENPIDLPVVQFNKIRFCDHSEDAKSFGIEVPPTLSARANQVIK